MKYLAHLISIICGVYSKSLLLNSNIKQFFSERRRNNFCLFLYLDGSVIETNNSYGERMSRV